MSLKNLVAKSELDLLIAVHNLAIAMRIAFNSGGNERLGSCKNSSLLDTVANVVFFLCCCAGILDEILGAIFKLGEWRVSKNSVQYYVVHFSARYAKYETDNGRPLVYRCYRTHNGICKHKHICTLYC